jgi:hypothetical protein
MPCSAELPRAIAGHRIRGEPDGGATSPLGRQHRTYPDTRRTAFATWTISRASCLSTACCSLLWLSTLAGAIGPTAFFDVDIDRAVVLLRAGWDRHWRPGAPAIAPSTRHRGGREECWSSEGPHWSGSTRPRFTTPKDSDPLTPSYGRPESHRGTPHWLGWLPKSSVLFAAVPGRTRTGRLPSAAFRDPAPMGSFVHGGNRVADPVVDFPCGDRHGRVSAGPGAAPASGRPILRYAAPKPLFV